MSLCIHRAVVTAIVNRGADALWVLPHHDRLKWPPVSLRICALRFPIREYLRYLFRV